MHDGTLPIYGGAEKYSVDSIEGATAFAGTGFDPDNLQHRIGSDAVRYAITVQQARDRGDYAAVDAARAIAVPQYFVMMGPGWTRVRPARLSDIVRLVTIGRRRKARGKTEDVRRVYMPIVDGILYDAEIKSADAAH